MNPKTMKSGSDLKEESNKGKAIDMAVSQIERLFGKGEITLHTYYYHEDNQSEKMHISSSLDETNLEVWQAMYAFRKVVQGFDETH